MHGQRCVCLDYLRIIDHSEGSGSVEHPVGIVHASVDGCVARGCWRQVNPGSRVGLSRVGQAGSSSTVIESRESAQPAPRKTDPVTSDAMALVGLIIGALAFVVTAAGVFMTWYIGRASGQTKKPDLQLFLMTSLAQARPGRERELFYVMPKRDSAVFFCSVPLVLVNNGQQDAEEVVVEAVGLAVKVPGLGAFRGAGMLALGGPVKAAKVECFESDKRTRWCFQFGVARRDIALGMDCPFRCTTDVSEEDAFVPAHIKNFSLEPVGGGSFWLRYDILTQRKNERQMKSGLKITCVYGTSEQDVAKFWAKHKKKEFAAAWKRPFNMRRWLELYRNEARGVVIIVPAFSLLEKNGSGRESMLEVAHGSKRWYFELSFFSLLIGKERRHAQLIPIQQWSTPRREQSWRRAES
jgi:hypothetical protein